MFFSVGFVYSTVPETCIEKWTLTPRQRFTGFDGILLGNTENGNIFNGDDLRLILQCIIGKENPTSKCTKCNYEWKS